jgi:membrane protease YdiL (CAAX protease family)
MIINNLISALIQLLVFAILPFIVYLAKHKTYKGFFRYVGLYKSTEKSLIYGTVGGLILGGVGILVMILYPSIKESAIGKDTVPGLIRQLDYPAKKVIIILITALIKTSFSEEILFRGFIAKRLINRLGYPYGNLLQSCIFGVVHILLFVGRASGFGFILFSFFVPAVGGYLSGYLNEKKGGGSILPGWLIHGTGNLIAYFYLIFTG